MNILIVGVSGFIGKHLYTTLEQSGYSVKGCSRQIVKNMPQQKMNWCPMDLSQSIEDWLLLLKNTDIVINAVGIYQATQTDSFAQTHDLGPKKLFDACQQAKVKVIQISAIGAEQAKPASEFLQSKRRADQYLLAKSSEHIVIYPGIVLGNGGRSSEQLLLLAHLPFIPLVFNRHTELPLVGLEQLSDFIIKLIKQWPQKQQTYCLISKPESIEQLLTQLRHCLGFNKACFIQIPEVLIQFIFKIFPQLSIGVLNQQSLTLLDNYNYNKESSPPELANISASSSMLKHGISQHDKYQIKIRAMVYLNLGVLSLIWIMSGISSLLNMPQSRELVSLVHVTGILGDIIIYVAAIGDIIIGLLLWLRSSWITCFQLGIIVLYSVIISFSAPILWLHPFAPIVKNLAMLVLSLYLLIDIKDKQK